MNQSTPFNIVRFSAAVLLMGVGVSSAGAQVINESGRQYSQPVGETDHLIYGTDVITNSGRLYVGSPLRSGSHDNSSGHVYVYDIATGALIHDLEAPADAENRDAFGYNIEVDAATIVVSTDEGRDNYQSGKDQVFVYDAITGDFMFELIPLSPKGEFYYDFGYDIAIENNLIAVGQPIYPTNDIYNGCVYIFDATTGALHDIIFGEDTDPNEIAYENFGTSVEMHNGLLAISRTPQDGFSTDTQEVHIYEAQTSTLLNIIVPPLDHNPSDLFGFAIAMNDDTLVVCAPDDDPYGSNTGTVYVYDIQTGDLRNTLQLVNPPTAFRLQMRAEINDNGLIAISSFNGNTEPSVKLFEAQTGEQVGSLVVSTGIYSGNWMYGRATAIVNNTIYVGPIQLSSPEGHLVYSFSTESTITGHPQSFATDTQVSHSLQVFATNATEFQWFRGGVAVTDGDLYTGANSSLLDLTLNGETEGVYTVEVTSNNTGVVMSEPAYLVYQGATTPACPADFTNDGILDFFDVSFFLQAYGAGCP